MKKVFCTAPWNGLTIREDGNVRTCCVGGTAIGSLHRSSIFEIKNSKLLIKIRNDLEKNILPYENCSSCIDQESRSTPSLREYYNKYYPSINSNNLNLQVVDLRWNNFCNLRCMYCDPQFSSTWDSMLNNTKPITIKTYQPELTNYIIDHAHEIKELLLVGGEPMLMKQNYDLIKRIPSTSKISIITNLSYDLENLPCIDSLLSRPKDNIIWNISLENTGAQFEYVRQLGSWDQIEKNLIFLNKHFTNTVSINFVYSMFSAFEINNTIKHLQKLGIKKINLMEILGNRTMDVLLMPNQIKNLAAAELANAVSEHKNSLHPEDIHFYSIDGADSFLNALKIKTTNPITKNEFYEKIKWYNQWSSTKFESLWPHILELIELYLT